MLVVIKPPFTQIDNADGLEAQQGRRVSLELSVDLCRQLARRILVRADPRSVTTTILVIAEVPRAAARVY